MKNQMVTIVQPKGDGVRIANGTKFVLTDGSEIKGVTRCVVKFEIDDIVTAQLDVALAQVEDIKAHPLLSLQCLREAAEYYGFDLVKKT